MRRSRCGEMERLSAKRATGAETNGSGRGCRELREEGVVG